jgi:hypothetical protein
MEGEDKTAKDAHVRALAAQLGLVVQPAVLFHQEFARQVLTCMRTRAGKHLWQQITFSLNLFSEDAARAMLPFSLITEESNSNKLCTWQANTFSERSTLMGELLGENSKMAAGLTHDYTRDTR